jgi:hypothetical protein
MKTRTESRIVTAERLAGLVFGLLTVILLGVLLVAGGAYLADFQAQMETLTNMRIGC